MLDRNMNFHTQKLSALLRISPYLDQRKKVLLHIQVNDKSCLIAVPWF